MSRIRLNKKQWSKIQPHLSGRAATGRPPADDKKILEAILFVLTTGCRWADLPREYGSYVTAWRRHRRWTQDGPLPVYGTCSFLILNSKENLISKSVHWMARLFGQKGGPTGWQNLWRLNQQTACRRRRERVTAGSGAV